MKSILEYTAEQERCDISTEANSVEDVQENHKVDSDARRKIKNFQRLQRKVKRTGGRVSLEDRIAAVEDVLSIFTKDSSR